MNACVIIYRKKMVINDILNVVFAKVMNAYGARKRGGDEQMKGNNYPGINMVRTGTWLRFICRARNIAVKELCSLLGLGSPQSIYGWFAGRTLPSLDNFYALSQIFCTTLDELIVNQSEAVPSNFCKKIGPQNARLIRYRIKFTF